MGHPKQNVVNLTDYQSERAIEALPSVHQHQTTLRRYVPATLFILFVVFRTSLFHQLFVSGSYSEHIAFFSAVYIPMLTVFLHVLLFRALPLWAFAVAMIVDTGIGIGIATYSEYFRDNVDIHTISHTLHEFIPIAGSAWELVPKKAALTLCILTAVQCWLLMQTPARTTKYIQKISFPIVCALAALGVYKVPLWQASSTLYYDRFIAVHGYYAAFLFDATLSAPTPSAEEVRQRLRSYNSVYPAKTLPTSLEEYTSDFRHIVTLQVESLDHAVLNRRYNAREITPYLNEVARAGIALRFHPHHSAGSGSSGADFQFFTGMVPLPEYACYKLPGLDTEQTLPALLKRHGMKTAIFDGTVKSYWGRAVPFQKMGISEFIDSTHFDTIDTRWGISDKTLLRSAKTHINRQTDPTLYLLMTLTSHVPFDYVEHAAFPRRTMVERYFNAINYTDEAIRELLVLLRGRHLVLIFGDHTSGLSTSEYDSRAYHEELVPGMLVMIEDGKLMPVPASIRSEIDFEQRYDIRSFHDLVKRVTR